MPHQIREIHKPYRTIVTCRCGWLQAVFHRNALARASLAGAAGRKHLKAHADTDSRKAPQP